MLDTRPGKPHAGLLIEGQIVRLSLRQEPFPRVFRQEDEAEMVGINALLPFREFRRQMRHKMMPRESECDGVARFPTQRTTKSINIEAFRRLHIMCGKSQMKEHVLHGHCPRTVGWPVPFHQPAVIGNASRLPQLSLLRGALQVGLPYVTANGVLGNYSSRPRLLV